MTEVCITDFKLFAGESFFAKFLRRGIDVVAFNRWAERGPPVLSSV
jgi:hypothetical protein